MNDYESSVAVEVLDNIGVVLFELACQPCSIIFDSKHTSWH
jgi:hypothetical protein